MATADLLQGDLPSTAMSAIMRGDRNPQWAIWFFMFFYLVHVATYALTSLKDEKNKHFIELRRKIFIPVISFGSYYLLNRNIGWFVFLLLILQLIAFMVAHAVCLVEQLAEKKNIIFSAAYGLGIAFWVFYWIMQIVEF